MLGLAIGLLNLSILSRIVAADTEIGMDELIGELVPMSDLTKAETYAAIVQARYSCRAFRSDLVCEDVQKEIFKTAQNTASWNNVQPWQVVVLSGKARDQLGALMQEKAGSGAAAERHFDFPVAYEGIYKDRRRACGFQLYEAVGIERGDKAAYARQTMRNFEFFDAPHIAIITSEADLGPYGLLDCGAYVTNVMQAAQSHGVATIAQAALANYADTIHQHLALPKKRRIVCAISFGWADSDHPINGYRVPRAELDEVVRWIDE